MSTSYTNRDITITELLKLAVSGRSKLPSIQRPFVWEPEKITLFVDSLLRGWPFGSMLFLKQEPGAPKIFPQRPFKLRQTDSPGQDNLPGYLVLDGQQRYQSIIIAFSPASKGYSLQEKEWKAINCRTLDHPRANEEISKHICFNLAAYSPGGRLRCHLDAESPDDADKTAWLTWKTKEEIELSHGKLIPLFCTDVPPAGFPEAEGYLKKILADIHDLKVPILEITPPESGCGNAEEQVVEIFTRLNTQGCPLTREQILGAKVKQVWNEFPDRLDEMKERLTAAPYHMGIIGDDDLVTGFNTLLKAHTCSKDISDAYARMENSDWEKLWQKFRKLTESLLQRLIDVCDIHYKKEYQSLHSLWFAIAMHHRCANGDEVREWDENLMHIVVKWLMLGNWSKMWANRSAQTVTALTAMLTAGELPGDTTAANLESWMNNPRLNMKVRSVDSMRNLKASARGSVRQYYTYLLVWMRLEPQRAKLLSAFKADYPAWQVDHILPAAWGKNNPAHYHELNGLGNCWLLNADANVIKGDSAFPDFMKAFDIAEQEELPKRIAASDICSLNRADIDAWDNRISDLIAAREKIIMNALENYINGDSAELSYARTDDGEVHKVLLNVDDIYRGSDYAETIAGCGIKTRHDYLLGVRRALQKLEWNAESGPLPPGSSREEVTAWLESAEANDIENRANLGNSVYVTGWKNYLKMLRGQNRRARNQNDRSRPRNLAANGMAVRKIHNQFPNFHAEDMAAYQQVVKIAILQGCSNIRSINRDALTQALPNQRCINALAQCYSDEDRRNGHFFDKEDTEAGTRVVFPQEVWEALCSIGWV